MAGRYPAVFILSRMVFKRRIKGVSAPDSHKEMRIKRSAAGGFSQGFDLGIRVEALENEKNIRCFGCLRAPSI